MQNFPQYVTDLENEFKAAKDAADAAYERFHAAVQDFKARLDAGGLDTDADPKPAGENLVSLAPTDSQVAELQASLDAAENEGQATGVQSPESEDSPQEPQGPVAPESGEPSTSESSEADSGAAVSGDQEATEPQSDEAQTEAGEQEAPTVEVADAPVDAGGESAA